MNLAAIYAEVKQRVDAVDFSALWHGFTPYRFALYDETRCCFDGSFIEKTDAFYANTAIEYQGEPIAIWKLSSEPDDLDALASSLIHEMFHAFQGASGESRWPDEMEALFRYEYCAENLARKLQEAAWMRRILTDGDVACYAPLAASCAYRRARFPYAYDYEARVEQIEGAANLVEQRALSQLDAKKGADRLALQLARIADPVRCFPIRILCYDVGAARLGCIRAAHAFDPMPFCDVPFAVQMTEGVPVLTPAPIDSTELADAIAHYQAETDAIVQSALQKADVVQNVHGTLTGVNIWDARRSGNCLTSRYFVAYRDGDNDVVLDGDFVVETDDARTLRALYRQ